MDRCSAWPRSVLSRSAFALADSVSLWLVTVVNVPWVCQAPCSTFPDVRGSKPSSFETVSAVSVLCSLLGSLGCSTIARSVVRPKLGSADSPPIFLSCSWIQAFSLADNVSSTSITTFRTLFTLGSPVVSSFGSWPRNHRPGSSRPRLFSGLPYSLSRFPRRSIDSVHNTMEAHG